MFGKDTYTLLEWLLELSVAVPVWKILRRAGFSGWWALVGVIPFANIIGLTVFALREWPVQKRKEPAV